MSMNLILLILILAVGYWLIRQGVKQVINKIGREKHIDKKRILYVNAVINFGVFMVFLVVGSVLLGIDYSHIAIFFSSAFALIGVAFFAQWSILSNVTASIIVFFFFPYRVGDKVKIVDGENSISGRIYEISLFHVLLKNENHEIMTYPNSLVFQKAVIINPKPAGENTLPVTQTPENQPPAEQSNAQAGQKDIQTKEQNK
ncbi:mechanosensitive ion channel family protein [Catenovulum sp. 2E275]|uniref:mechanosensitive ion channel domain-containing protein n=1 Tax=Catenovulum sp. 2E275 TaxID=2980497 RepID=UPI0021D1A147|nr:mechanosensitive ion channel family protein [Catenovulum sp. 2E275]MCU4674594.1 mechanosensitive ion channel family protein [Catenovulum sp. 2E275]